MAARLCLLLLALVATPGIVAGCLCPPAAESKHLLLAVGTKDRGLVACGYEDERRGDTVVASEFQIFRCGGERPLLEFGALQTALLRGKAGALHVTEVEQWPFGREWQWTRVPVREWHLSARSPQPQVYRTLRSAPAVTRRDIEAFLGEYKRWLAVAENARSYEETEEYVARLFTSAVAGHREADALFLTMSDDAGLDGAAAETYSRARMTYDAWQELRPRLLKE